MESESYIWGTGGFPRWFQMFVAHSCLDISMLLYNVSLPPSLGAAHVSERESFAAKSI